MQLRQDQIAGPYTNRPWRYLGIGRSTFFRKVAEGIFPSGVHLCSRQVLWPEKALDEAMQSIAAHAGGEVVSADHSGNDTTTAAHPAE